MQRGIKRRGIGLALVLAVVLTAWWRLEADDAGAHQQPGRPYEVGRIDVEFIDDTRKTPADDKRGQSELDQRTLPVMVLYPAKSAGEETRAARGKFPLVVFAHGHSRTGTEYEELLSRWVEAGYVVAAPTFPLSSGPEATPDNIASYADALNQPGDISFVIDQLVKRAEDPDDILHKRIDPEAVGVVGHSLGAITTLGMRNHSGSADPAVDAYVSVAGMDFLFPKEDLITERGTPLLLIHGGTDPTVPVGGSESVFENSPGPSWFLRYDQGGHDEVLEGDAPPAVLTEEAILAFFDRKLRHHGAAWKKFARQVEQSGLGTLQENS